MEPARRVSAAAALAAACALALPSEALARGDEVPISELAGAWRFEPAVVVLALVGLVLFAQATVRLRRREREDHASLWRAALFVLATTLGVLALVSPLDAVGEEYLLSGHMLQHVVIGEFVPVLLIVSLRGPILFFFVPALALRALARHRAVRGTMAFLLLPAVSLSVWAITIAAWHVPAAYDSVLGNPVAHDLEHATLVVAGVLVWMQLIDPARRRALGQGGKLAFALLLFVAGQALASALIFAPGPLYPAYAAQDERLLGLSPFSDQVAAGLVMMVAQTITLGTWAAYQLRAHFSQQPLAIPEPNRHPLAL